MRKTIVLLFLFCILATTVLASEVLVTKQTTTMDDYYPDSNIQFIVNITNNGTTDLVAISLTDTYNYTCMNYTWSNITPMNISPGNVIWNLSETPLAPENSQLLLINFTALSECNTTNNVYVNATNSTSFFTNDWAYQFNILSSSPPSSSSSINVTLLAPANGSTITTNKFEVNFSVNTTANCWGLWNFSAAIEFMPEMPPDVPEGWIDLGPMNNGVSGTVNANGMGPNGVYTWNVRCANPSDSSDYAWASANWTFTIAGSMPDCFGKNESACELTANCTWEVYAQSCMMDCIQYDYTNVSTCEGAFGGGLCAWEESMSICDPDFGDYMDDGFDGFSFCFEYDGNKTGCDNFPDDCKWFSEPNCQVGDWCYDDLGSGANSGFCDPTNFNWGGDFSCWTYDGNKTGCKDSGESLGWACTWNPDPWAPLMDGTEAGWCNPMFSGGGGGGEGCFDAWDETGCNDKAAVGQPCTWMTGGSDSGWCEEKGCWNYWNSGDCAAAASEGCQWNSNYMYCYKPMCWDLTNETGCTTTAGLDCTWHNNSVGDGGWCEENGCWKRDWTNSTYCEAQDGCKWEEPGWCKMDGCWDYEADPNNCVNESLGLNCQWSVGEWGWCEQIQCWQYDGNQTGCEAASTSYGIDCTWDAGPGICYQNFGGCTDYDNDEFGCYGTGWCYWNPVDSRCKEPEMGPMEFFNPGCWAFNQAGEVMCGNITSCDWTSGECVDNINMGDKGVQCADINSSELCNKIPMLSSCCTWNGTDSGCIDAHFTTSCWDNMQAPPEGANFCDDYNAKTSKSTCNQIAGDPWYMPCEWDNTTSKCQFQFNDMFGGDATGFQFKDIGSKANCEAMGGIWISESWKDPATGAVYNDEWCDMAFGFGKESCANACWACEFQDNGSDWSTANLSRQACEDSNAGCNYYADSNAFNGFGWCDFDWGKSGNCDQNCWECWDQSLCSNSLAGCKWFTDPWNNNAGWCDGKNIKTCDGECYSCWDSNNCQDSDAGCTWDTTYNFCKPTGSDQGGSSEVCFDGIDNDADSFVDCSDPECMFDNFCGGSSVFGSDCLSISTQATCEDNGTKGFNCTWIVDNWGGEWCDMPGSQCWLYDENETACDLEDGCQYKTMEEFGKADGFICDINKTVADTAQCWNYGDNSTNCGLQPNCVWVEDKWCSSPQGATDQWCLDMIAQNITPGFCDFELWSCHSYNDNSTACGEQTHCAWQTDWFNPTQGWCDPVCFNRNESTCANDVNLSGTMTAGVCQLMNASEMGWCEPERSFKGCWGKNMVDCQADDACSWIDDPFAGDFCGDKFMFNMVENMDNSPPQEIGSDACDGSAISAQSDICFLGIKDDPGQFGFSTGVWDMSQTKICADRFNEFSGSDTSKFYWYLDTNGNSSGGCNATDDSTLGGFDFKLKYVTKEQDGSFVETKVAYKCVDGIWSPSKIKLNAMPNKMCYMVIGGVVAIEKADLQKLSVLGLYNKTADMRIYATTADENGSDSNVSDTIGPLWYSPGAADFKFEDCAGFTDKDGDGLTPENDPDCVDFLKYGFIDIERGVKCDDNIDNDGNGLTDCNDPSCAYDAYYCEVGTDTSSPTITWFDVEEMLDGAFVSLDTNEPTNGTVLFFLNSSYLPDISCFNQTSALKVLDPKLGNSFTKDDYDFWHDFPVEQVYFDDEGLAFNFSPSTTYYFKTKVCDASGNCALSSCTNFTTEANASEFTVGFNLPAPASDVTAALGSVVVSFDLNNDGVYGDSVINSSYGTRMNDSIGKNVNIKFFNPSASSGNNWSVYFYGADLLKAITLNISQAFKVNGTSTTMVGMDTNKWSELAQKLGVDKVIIVIPEGVPADYTGGLVHCPDDATGIDDPDCTTIDMDDVNCTFTTTTTTCEIPVSIGFSLFGVTSTSGGDDPQSPGGGGGGGGGGGVAGLSNTYTKTWQVINAGVSNDVNINQEFYAVPFMSLQFKANKELLNPELKVSVLGAVPTLAGPFERTVFTYLSLTETNFESSDIYDTKITFRVPVSWFVNNSFHSLNLALFRFVGDKWVEQPTTATVEAEGFQYYDVVTSGFSYFVIGEKGELVVANPVNEEVVDEDITGEVVAEEEIITGETETTDKTVTVTWKKTRGALLWGLLIVVVVAILMYVFFKEGKVQKGLRHEKRKEYGVHVPHDDLGKLDSFVEKQLGYGYPESQIKHTLKEAGWADDKVEASMKKFRKPN
ncbi:MAG: PGF-pre-PGF domain-containing protein [archaeon]